MYDYDVKDDLEADDSSPQRKWIPFFSLTSLFFLFLSLYFMDWSTVLPRTAARRVMAETDEMPWVMPAASVPCTVLY